MRISKNTLRKIISEEVAAVISLGGSEMAAPNNTAHLGTAMTDLLGCLRSAGVWFHAAHNLAKGTSFSGDHVNLYGEIYGALVEDYDGAAEKAIGLTRDEMVACPHSVMAIALEKMGNYQSPSGAPASAIAGTALKIMEDLNEHVESLFSDLEASGNLALGLNDFLAAAANDYTTYIYLLQQRTKE
jgi:hypothetical protein